MKTNRFIDNLLQTPSYGWQDEQGRLIVPSQKQLWGEAFRRINFFQSRKNWISAMSWVMVACICSHS